MKIAWVTPKGDLKIDKGATFSTIASVRYRAIIPAAALAGRGIATSIVEIDEACFDTARAQLSDCDCVVFRKNYGDHQSTERMLSEIRQRGVRTAFDLSDDPLGAEHTAHIRKMVCGTDIAIAASPMLADLARQWGQEHVAVITDPYEGEKGDPRWAPGDDRLRVLWFGHPTNLPSLYPSLPALLEAGRRRPIELKIITQRVDGIERACKDSNARHRSALTMRFAEWSMSETRASLAATDLVLIPSQPGDRRALSKSPNRMIESLWAGRFVIAHPVPSYREFEQWACVKEDLREALTWLLVNAGNTDAIEDRIRRAQEHIAAHYSPERISLDWLKIARASEHP